ncbi:MAG: hypothetical protein PUC61_08785 [Bacteroidales bacterium]|nr:hypothetical protein [Bacteroidales bacterium]
MDIDLLSKMVKELILDSDRVVLPGLGCFVAEIVPSTFSDKGYTINPPYRRLSFRSKPTEGDALAQLYAISNNIDVKMADRIIRDFLQELKSVLHTKKTVVFPALGRLRATKENNLFFVADEYLDIFPAGFGLEPVSLKNHQETKEEVAAAVKGLASILTSVENVEPEPVVEPIPEPEQIPEPEPEPIIEPISEPEQIPEPEPEPVVEPMPEPDPIPEPEPEPVVEPIPAPEPIHNPDPYIEPEPIPEPEPVIEPIPEIEPDPEPLIEPHPEDFRQPAQPTDLTLKKTIRRNRWRKAAIITGSILAAAVVLLALFVVLADLAPDFIDKLLYSAEELEILNYKLE